MSGGHTFLVEMRDHLAYRLLGQTVDDAAGEAFDKVGRLLGLGYPGGPAIERAAAERDAARRRLPAGLARRLVRLQLQRPQDGGAADRRRGPGDAGLADGRGPLPGDAVAELAYGFQDSVVDVLATKTIRAAEAVGARSIVLGGGVAANAPLRERLAGEAAALGHPARRAAAGAVHGQRGDDRRGRGPPRSRPASAPGWTSTPGPSLPLATTMSGRRRASPRLDPPPSARTLRGGRPAARATRSSQNFLADPDVLDDDPAPRPTRAAAGGVLEIGPGLGILTGGAAGRRRRPSRPSSSTAGWRRSCASATRMPRDGERDPGRRAACA